MVQSKFYTFEVMSDILTIQNILVLLIVGAALFYLIRRFFFSKKSSTCDQCEIKK